VERASRSATTHHGMSAQESTGRRIVQERLFR